MNDCFIINRAFRAWDHQFLYNMQTLTALLQNAGFAEIESYSYGESEIPALRHLKHHEQYPDTPGFRTSSSLRHAVIALQTQSATTQCVVLSATWRYIDLL